jgi:hypothetical protein
MAISKNIKLTQDWIDDKIHKEGLLRFEHSVLTYDSEYFWNGHKCYLLALKNRPLKCLVVVRAVSLSSLNREMLDLISSSDVPKRTWRKDTEKWEEILTPQVVDWRVARIDRIDPSMATCDLVTLQPWIMNTSVRMFKSIIRRYSTDNHDRGDKDWANQKTYLDRFSLSIPEEYETKRILAVAKARLKQ